MYDFQTITPNRTAWADDIPGFTGNEGWYEDTDTHRIIFVAGVWWDDNKDAPWNGKGDIFNVLGVFPKRFGKHYGHGGFIRYAESAITTLLACGALQTDKPLLILGHSMGAGIAPYLAMRLQELNKKVDNVILYACPTAWGSPGMRKKFKTIFPNAESYVVGNDYTQFTGLLTFPLLYGPPIKPKHIKRKYKSFKEWKNSFIDDHWPWMIKSFIEPPFDN